MLIRERDKLPDPELTTIEANRCAVDLMNLEFAERNLLRALRGQSGIVRIEGGVTGVR